MPEQPLLGGRSRAGVVRSGTTVRRPQTAGSPFVHRVLRRLEPAGVNGVPRFLGIDSEDREILSYLSGDTGPGIDSWSDEQLAALAQQVRSIHDAMAGSPEAGAFETVCHNDLAPWNTILHSGRPVAFIDFDDVAPGNRADDLAYLLWVFLDLGTPSASADSQGRRMRHVCDVYAAPQVVSTVPEPAAPVITTTDQDLGSRIRSELLAALDRQQHRILDFRASRSDPFSATKHAEILTAMHWTARHRTTLESRLR